jgi:GH24 family phage-related lysozyme (muramidase)
MGLLHGWHPKCYSIEQAFSLLGRGSTEVMPGELGGEFNRPAKGIRSSRSPREAQQHRALSIKHRVVAAVKVLCSGKQQGARASFTFGL